MRNFVAVNTCACIYLVFCISLPSARAGANRYRQTIDEMASAAGLPSEQRPRFKKALSQVDGYGVCHGQLDMHLKKARPHPLCVQLGTYIAYLIKKKVDKQGLQRLMIKRQRTMCGPAKARFSLDKAPYKGDVDGSVTLVDFFDFQCWACQRLSGILDAVIKGFEQGVVLYHKQYPLKNHPNSALASLAALAAQKQGKYWEMVNLLFVISPDHDKENILKYATELDLDLKKLQADMADPGIRKRVVQSKKEGRLAGIKATPTLFLNGRLVELPDDEFIIGDIIREELRRKRAKPGADPSCR